MAKQIRVQIQEPCKENWNEMTPTQQGAFCKSCSKNVIDFSNKTGNEIYNFLSVADDNVCGRFREDQLNVPITKSEINSSIFNWKAIAASLAALVMAEKGFALRDNGNKPPVVIRPPFVAKPPVIQTQTWGIPTTVIMGDTTAVTSEEINAMRLKPVFEKKDTLKGKVSINIVTIYGRVVDSISRLPIEGASVYTNEGSGKFEHYSTTDSMGYFTLTCPINNTKVVFSRSYDHETREMKLKDVLALQTNSNNKNKTFEIALTPQEQRMFMGMMMRVK
ncbi:MAG: hypothetical protein JWO06_56 [Bacteroidota bacterium]|nr:hypothetical protein [Bacteroidota bacterium]